MFTKLLDFVGLYGLLLVPVGAIVFTEHWIFPRLGFTQLWAEKKGVIISWPALISWFAGLGFALVLYYGLGVSLFYLFLPTWFVAMILYIALASVMGARDRYPEAEAAAAQPAGKTAPPRDTEAAPAEATLPPPKHDPVLWVARVVAVAALAVCLLWPIWIYIQGVDGFEARFDAFRTWLIVPTLVYFVFGTMWAIRRDRAT